MPKVSAEHRAARRDAITTAAMEVFREHGFHSASMADIISRSGLSAGAIYGYFSSKEDIIHEVADAVVGARVDQLENFVTSAAMPTPPEIVRILLDGMTSHIPDPHLIVQLWGEALTDSAVNRKTAAVFTRLTEAYAAYISHWQQREHGLPPAEAEAVGKSQAPLFLAVAQGAIVQSALVADFDREMYLATVEAYLPR